MVLFDAAVAFKTAKDLVTATPLTRVPGKPNFTDMEMPSQNACRNWQALT